MSLINKLLYRATASRPCRLIKLDGAPYLERYYLGQLFGATFYLHRFVSSDRERHTHNHPWGWGRALVLCGGYDEEVVTDLTTSSADGYLSETRRVRFWNRVNGSHFHRIANALPGTWTLFFHGPRVMIDRGHVTQPKGWGFLTRSGNAVAYLPFPSAASEWWKTAAKGRDVGRVPLWQHIDPVRIRAAAVNRSASTTGRISAMAAAYGASPSSGAPDEMYAEAAKGRDVGRVPR